MQKLNFFNNRAEVYVLDSELIGVKNESLPDLFLALPPIEQQKYNSFTNLEAKLNYLVVHSNLRLILSQKLGQNPQNIRIETNPRGKPFLTDYPKLFFSLSHTKGMALIGFSSYPIGIDIEPLNRKTEKEAILKHFFSEAEQQSYFSQNDEIKQKAFFTGWTRKEALLKATGEGLAAMRDYKVSFDPEALNPVISIKNKHKYEIVDFTPSKGYQGCIALLYE